MIGNAMDENNDGPGPGPGPAPAPGPVSENRAGWAAGYWIDEQNNRFTVTHSGAGFVASNAAVVIRGQFTSPTTAVFTATFANGAQINGEGRVYPDGNGSPHMSYSLANGGRGDFRINHMN